MTGYTVIAGQTRKEKNVGMRFLYKPRRVIIRLISSYATTTASNVPAAVAVSVDLLIDAVVSCGSIISSVEDYKR